MFLVVINHLMDHQSNKLGILFPHTNSSYISQMPSLGHTLEHLV